ncbi:MAG: ROK family protein [Bauldia sp.]|nr:ROK family protein [Bauldia sp.]
MALRGTNQEFGRPYNRRIVLETIRLHAPITRADIAKRVGLTIQTVSTIIRELETQGFLIARREAPKGRGSPATVLSMNPEGGFAVGVHVTPLGVEAALINLAGAVIGRERRDLPRVDPDTAFSEIKGLVRQLGALRPNGRMLGVGMAMPGPFDVESMSFVGPTTLEGWKDVPVRQSLTLATGLPAFIEIDLAAAAHGERLYGRGSDFRDFYYLYFVVGLGGCMVHDGTALRGAWGNAGEIGHIPVVPEGDLCPCGNRGCLERYLSLEAHERRARVIGEDQWLAEVAPIFRQAIATIENLFDPETIIVGGLAPKPLLSRLVAAASPLPNSIAARRTRTADRLTLSAAGQDAVLRGAAALAVSGVLSPRFGLMFTQDVGRGERDPIMRDAGRAQAA